MGHRVERASVRSGFQVAVLQCSADGDVIRCDPLSLSLHVTSE